MKSTPAKQMQNLISLTVFDLALIRVHQRPFAVRLSFLIQQEAGIGIAQSQFQGNKILGWKLADDRAGLLIRYLHHQLLQTLFKTKTKTFVRT